jgi:hypothetical protein
MSCLLLQVTDHICKLQEYVNGMARLQIDEHEYAYLKAITLFSAGEFKVTGKLLLELPAQICSKTTVTLNRRLMYMSILQNLS